MVVRIVLDLGPHQEVSRHLKDAKGLGRVQTRSLVRDPDTVNDTR